LVDYCQLHQIEIDASPDEPLYSTDENLLHTSYEGEILEDPSIKAPDEIWQRTVAPVNAPDEEEIITIEFKQGEPVSIDGNQYTPSNLLTHLNSLAGKHGIGRLDLVENRFTGMKSRGCYETPGGTILLKAHRAMESITLDSQAGHLKDDLMPKYAQLIYDGFWWSPEREALQALIDKTQEFVTGSVELSLYKGNVSILGRSSNYSLYDSKIVTFEDDENAYNQADATGFIKINSLRLRQIAKRNRKSNQ
jgi:argininosuccinate synthase